MGPTIRFERARRVAQVLGELSELGAGTEAARRHLADSALSVVGASVCALVLDAGYGPGLPADKQFTTAGFDDASLRILVPTEACSTIPSQREMMLLVEREPRKVVNAARSEDLISRRQWQESPWVNDYAQPAGLDHFLSSVFVLGDGVVEATGLMRSALDAPFTVEDRDALHLLHLGCGRLFRERTRKQLAPRIEQTLQVLLVGASDKEIAQQLRISVHTVRQYVKEIYRAYGVSSRAQLIVRHRRDAS